MSDETHLTCINYSIGFSDLLVNSPEGLRLGCEGEVWCDRIPKLPFTDRSVVNFSGVLHFSALSGESSRSRDRLPVVSGQSCSTLATFFTRGRKSNCQFLTQSDRLPRPDRSKS